MTRTFRWQKIDETTLADHTTLTSNDNCIFIGHYNAGDGYDENTDLAINSTIHNLKILDTQHHRVPHKLRAVAWCKRALMALNADWAKTVTWVPIPPSKTKDDEAYNPKMSQVLEAFDNERDIDFRELVFQTVSTNTSHGGEVRLSVDDLLEVYSIDENLVDPEPTRIILFDDVLSTGNHFRAMQRCINSRFPACTVEGVFIARRIPKKIDPFTGFDDLDF